MTPIKAWHFAKEDRRLNYGDDRLIHIGETHTLSTAKNRIRVCGWGLHASKRITDALFYAPGPIIYRVELSGIIVTDDNKIAASNRTYLWGFDATDILRAFSRRCALDVIHIWNAPDIVIEYLKTGDDTLRAAARDPAWDAARDAARDPAWAAARTAARDPARDAAWAAARAAARAAAWDAARTAARAAARAAAWDAARDEMLNKYNRRLTSMIVAEHIRAKNETT